MTMFALPICAAEQTVVGKVGFAKGSNAAQQPNSAPRLLGKDAEIYQGDNIQTSDASFVILEFKDGSKVTVRPNSNFKIEQFDVANKNVKLAVYEGGVRAATGEIAKAGDDNFQIKTPTTTLKGAKDSDYSVRVCNQDCEKDKTDDVSKDTSVAKVVDVKGDVFAENRTEKNTNKRKLAIGDGLNAQDYLTSLADSYLVMVFRDGEKVTLQPNSEFDIVKYDFQKADKKDELVFKLVSGGMRALTGSIGKKDHTAYTVNTPVATIGIRGTEYETVCMGSCSKTNDNNDGMYVHVTEGAISQTNGTGETILTQGQNSFIANQNTPVVEIPVLPARIIQQINNTPSPKIAPNPEKFYGSPHKIGSFVTVNKGNGRIESNSPKDKDTESNFRILLKEGESRFAGNGKELAVKLNEIPTFIAQDDTPPPESIYKLSVMPSPFSLKNNDEKANSAGCVVK